MSWSVGATGKAPTVAEQIAKQFENGSKCAEPEETIRQAAKKLIETSLEAQDPAKDVQVSAYGSQSVYDVGSPNATFRNSLSISITPQN